MAKNVKDLSVKDLSEKEWNSLIAREKRQVNRATISLWRCCENGRIPPSHSQDNFGVIDDITIKAMQWAIKNRIVTPVMLDNMKMKGPEITNTVVTKENPYKAVFKTIVDL